MQNQKNPFYSQTIEQFFSDKDSVMEMAKIIDFDGKRLTARVFTLHSKQYRDDVPVFFPSMYLNTGIISPPVKDSTSLLFWGADRQPFLLPIQLTVPNAYVEDNVTKINASPGFNDKLLSLENIKGGEQLFRSLGGAYVFLKNLGDVELGTSRMHRMYMSSADGSFNLFHDRIRAEVGDSHFYFGPASYGSEDDLRTHYYFGFGETADALSTLPSISDEELLDNVINDEMESITLQQTPKLSVVQMGHVFDDEGSIVTDEEDGTDLFSHRVMTKDNVSTVEQLSKGGRKKFVTTDGERTTIVSVSPSEVMVSVNREVDGTTESTEIGIDEQGNIVCSKEGKSYDLWQVLEWFYEQRT